MKALTIAEARSEIVKQFKRAWTEACNDAGIEVKYLLENVKDNTLYTNNKKDPFAICEVSFQPSQWRGLVGKLVQYEGRLDITIHIPTGKGMAFTDKLALPLIKQFRQAEENGVRYSRLSPIDMGVESNWHKKMIRCNIRFYNCEQR